MKKTLPIILILIVSIFIFSCEKTKLGTAKACMNFGNTKFAAGKVIYFMNCSENYNLSKWRIYDSTNTEVFASTGDTTQHLSRIFSTGTWRVDLKVWQSMDTSKNNTISETIQIN